MQGSDSNILYSWKIFHILILFPNQFSPIFMKNNSNQTYIRLKWEFGCTRDYLQNNCLHSEIKVNDISSCDTHISIHQTGATLQDFMDLLAVLIFLLTDSLINICIRALLFRMNVCQCMLEGVYSYLRVQFCIVPDHREYVNSVPTSPIWFNPVSGMGDNWPFDMQQTPDSIPFDRLFHYDVAIKWPVK